MLQSLRNQVMPIAALSGGMVMPSGALGIWYADQYDAATKAIPNAAVGGSPSANIFRASRRMFSKTEWWSKGPGTGTITDDAATGPTGSENNASTMDLSGNWVLAPLVATYSIPAGTYVLAISAKRNTGTDQQFCFTKDYTTTKSAIQTATSAWQRFTYTFTNVGTDAINLIGICSIDGSTGANLQICDFELYAGSSDLGPQSYVGDLYLGANAYDTRPSYVAGELNLSTGGYGLIQFAAATTISSTGVTAIALVSRVAAGSSFQSFLSKVQAHATFTASSSISNAPCDFTEVAFAAVTGTGLWPTQGAGYHAFTHRYDGTNRDLFLDDLKILRKTLAVSDFTLRDFYVGLVNTVALPCGYKVVGIALWNRALSDTEIRTAYVVLQARAAASSIVVTPQSRVGLFTGDSRTGSTTTRWPYVFGPNASPSVFGANLGISGSTLANLQTRIAEVTGAVPPNMTGRKIIAVVGQMGANDLATYTGATDAIAAQNYANAVGVYTDALYAAGVTSVALCTEPPVGNGTNTHNTRRALLNTIYKTAYPGAHAVTIIDFAADATMGTDTSFTDHPTDWTDSTHQSAAGDVIFEGIARPVINGL